jgi:hypothetical protein
VNLNGFAAGDPVNYLYPFGLWPRRTHSELIRAAVANRADANALAFYSMRFDASLSQLASRSYQHGMRQEGQTVEHATYLRDAFVSAHMQAATDAASRGYRGAAMAELAIAMHTVMDSYSPAHREADGSPAEWRFSDRRAHAATESRPPTASERAAMIGALQRMYQEVLAASRRSDP